MGLYNKFECFYGSLFGFVAPGSPFLVSRDVYVSFDLSGLWGFKDLSLAGPAVSSVASSLIPFLGGGGSLPLLFGGGNSPLFVL